MQLRRAPRLVNQTDRHGIVFSWNLSPSPVLANGELEPDPTRWSSFLNRTSPRTIPKEQKPRVRSLATEHMPMLRSLQERECPLVGDRPSFVPQVGDGGVESRYLAIPPQLALYFQAVTKFFPLEQQLAATLVAWLRILGLCGVVSVGCEVEGQKPLVVCQPDGLECMHPPSRYLFSCARNMPDSC